VPNAAPPADGTEAPRSGEVSAVASRLVSEPWGAGGGQGNSSGWFPDPLGRYEHRWYNGTTWTADVSVDGQRYVDPLPVQSPYTMPPGSYPLPMGDAAPGWGPNPGGKRPTRTMAVLAFIGGLASIVTGWIPFVFVLGIAAGITGLVLGIIARRRVGRGEALGGGLATAAIVLSPIGLALCVVGAIWSVAAYREFVDYLEPGPTDVEITSCTLDGPGVRITGTIENLSGTVQDYTITIDVFDGRERIERSTVEVVAVGSRSSEEWEDLVLLRGQDVSDPVCEVSAVNGPFPFGIDPEP
jgi:hypothetical protein